MFAFSILAAVATATAPRTLPEQTQILTSLSSAQLVFPLALCVIGGLLMGIGFKAYRWIVFLNFIALGYWEGGRLGEPGQIGIIGAVIGAVLMGVAAMPLMKYAVAVCGGMVGAVIGMVIWAYCEQPMDMAWAGGLVGLAVLGMLSFILFKTSVILFTSIEGASMFVLGACALLLRYKPWAADVGTNLNSKPALIPLLVVSLAAVALFWQHQRHGLIGNEGAPSGGAKPAASGDKKK